MTSPSPDSADLPLEQQVLRAARSARDNAYAPYSGFRVGAAVVSREGGLYSGANVENASYGLTVCAERIAVWSATVAGAPALQLLALVTDTAQPVAPCGACRQVLAELAPDAEIIMATVGGIVKRSTVQALLPFAFGREDIERAD